MAPGISGVDAEAQAQTPSFLDKLGNLLSPGKPEVIKQPPSALEELEVFSPDSSALPEALSLENPAQTVKSEPEQVVPVVPGPRPQPSTIAPPSVQSRVTAVIKPAPESAETIAEKDQPETETPTLFEKIGTLFSPETPESVASPSSSRNGVEVAGSKPRPVSDDMSQTAADELTNPGSTSVVPVEPPIGAEASAPSPLEPSAMANENRVQETPEIAAVKPREALVNGEQQVQSPTFFDKIGQLFSPRKPEKTGNSISALEELEISSSTPAAPLPPEPSPTAHVNRTQTAPDVAAVKPPEALVNGEPQVKSPTFFDKIGQLFSPSKPEKTGNTLAALEEREVSVATPADPGQSVKPDAAEVLSPDSPSPVEFQKTETGPQPGKSVSRQKTPSPTESQAVPASGATGGDTERRFNPFTRLTDLILDILPDSDTESGPVAVVEKAEPDSAVDVGEKAGTDNAGDGAGAAEPGPPKRAEVIYPVTDLTVADDPYKVVKPARQVTAPLPEQQPTGQTETAGVPPETPAQGAVPPEPEVVDQKALVEDDLSFADGGMINTRMRDSGASEQDCVVKKTWDSHFCIQTFHWPPEIMPAFGLPGFYSGGGQSIVHYLAGKSVQYHGLFPAHSFDQIADFLLSQYGAPTRKPQIWTAMLAEARRLNRTYQWIAQARDGGRDVVLEIREIDDLRWSSPPDKHNGVIRLYREGDETVFRLLTSADLLLLQVRKGNDPPSPPQAKSQY